MDRILNCLVFGHNEVGFKKLFQIEFGMQQFAGKSWATLTDEECDRIEDLIGK